MTHQTSDAKQSGGMRSMGQLLMAVGVGYAVGVLFAPRSGRETRQAIARKATETRDTAREQMMRGKEKVQEALSKAGEHAREGRNMLQETTRTARTSPSAT